MRELTVILFCAFKFALTFPVAIYAFRMSFGETLLYTNIGGLLGLLASVYFSKLLIVMWDTYVLPLYKKSKQRKERKIFNRRNRFIVRIKTKYGFPGIVVLTPVLFSIPVGGFLMTKYYGISFRNLSWMFTGQVAWSLAYTVFYMFIRSSLRI